MLMRFNKHSVTQSISNASIVVACFLLLLFSCKKTVVPPVPGVISGALNLCPGDSGITYSIAPVSGADYYLWTVPDDSKIISGQGTTSIVINFGKHSGKICVKSCNDNEVSEASCLNVTQGGVLGQWCREADFVPGNRSNAVGFAVGGKGYISTGADELNTRYNDLWEYDPQLNTWTQKADLPDTARYDALAFVIGDKAYLGTGWEGNIYFNDLWEYSYQLNQWQPKADFPGGKRCYAYTFAVNGKGYVGGGRLADFTFPSDLWEYNPATDSWTQKTGNVPSGSSVGFSIGNKAYMGLGLEGVAKKYFWEYDPLADTWTQMPDFPGNARFCAAGFAVGDKGYIGLGYDSENNYNDFYEWNPQTATWTPLPDFEGVARGYVISFAIGNNGYVGLGNPGNNGTTAQKDFWVYGVAQ